MKSQRVYKREAPGPMNRDQVRTEPDAILTHRAVGEEVRTSIVKDKGVRPEDLPIQPSIKPLILKHQRQLKNGKPLSVGGEVRSNEHAPNV